MHILYAHRSVLPASEERVACFMAALTCGAIREAFIGLAYVNAATRGERCWS